MNFFIQKLLHGFTKMNENTEEGKQYASLFNTVLPVIKHMMSGPSGVGAGTGAAPSPISLLLNLAGPLLSQVNKF